MSDGLNKCVAINNYVFSKLKPGFPKDLSFVWKHAFSTENRSTIMESFQYTHLMLDYKVTICTNL